MGLAPSLVIQLPGYPFENFPSLAALYLLRQVPSGSVAAEDNYVIDGDDVAGDGGGGVYAWNPSSTATDDGSLVIKPNDRSPGQAGRWVKTAGRDLKAVEADLTDLAEDIAAADAKLSQYLRTARDSGAVVDGITDTRAALAAADALGSFHLTPGLYLVASNLTVTNRIVFDPGARIVVPNGVTVTLSGGIEAGSYQIFNLTGTGAIAGLRNVDTAWFAADVAANTNAIPQLQKAMDACATGADVLWSGSYYSNGAAYLTVTKGQLVRGLGRNKSKLLWTTAACLGLRLTTSEGAMVSGLKLEPSDISIIPSSGVAVLVEAVNCTVEKNYSTHCYIGVQWLSVNGGKDLNNNFNGSTYSANWISNSPNIEITNANGSAFSDWVDLSTTTGFVPGESLTFASGGTGSWGYTTSATRAKILINDVSPTIGTTITGATSGTVATLTALVKGHQGGGLRLTDNAAGCNVVGSAWAGGVYSGFAFTANDAHGTRPEYTAIVSCYFDHADEGFRLNQGAGLRLVGNWFSSRAGDGVFLGSATHTTIQGCTIAHSWNNGVLIGLAAKSTVITGNIIQGNNRSNSSKAGVYVISAATDFIIHSNRIGGATAGSFDGLQARPVNVEAGASDRYVIKSNLVSGNANNAILDGGTGVNKAVGENF